MKNGTLDSPPWYVFVVACMIVFLVSAAPNALQGQELKPTEPCVAATMAANGLNDSDLTRLQAGQLLKHEGLVLALGHGESLSSFCERTEVVLRKIQDAEMAAGFAKKAQADAEQSEATAKTELATERNDFFKKNGLIGWSMAGGLGLILVLIIISSSTARQKKQANKFRDSGINGRAEKRDYRTVGVPLL